VQPAIGNLNELSHKGVLMKISCGVPTKNTANENRDRFLTSFMGACWHETTGEPVTKFGSKGFMCIKCGMFFSAQNDYSMPEDFLKLWEWAKNDSRLEEFIKKFRPADFLNARKGARTRKLFADGLYALLSTRGENDV
jgi:hypothetical protein